MIITRIEAVHLARSKDITPSQAIDLVETYIFECSSKRVVIVVNATDVKEVALFETAVTIASNYYSG